MIFKRQSKLNLLALSLLFTGTTIVLPALRRQALAEEQQVQPEEVTQPSTKSTNTEIQPPADQETVSENAEAPQVPIEEALRSDESGSHEQPSSVAKPREGLSTPLAVIVLIALSPILVFIGGLFVIAWAANG